MKFFVKIYIVSAIIFLLSIPCIASISDELRTYIENSSDIRDIQNFPPELLPCHIKNLFIIPSREDRTRLLLIGKGKDGTYYDFGRVEFKGELNTAKTDVLYDEEDGLIHIYSQMPFSAFYYGATYRWEKEKLILVKEWSEDPSAEALKEINSLLSLGEIDKASEKLNNMFYPGNYYDSYEMKVKFLRSACKYAVDKYRKGSNDSWKVIKSAITVLADKWVFQFKSKKEYENSDFSKYMPFNEFLEAVNNYGFLMEQSGKVKDAIFVLTYVINLSPERTPACLNLGDALYKDGRKEEAKKYYKTYIELMKKDGKEKLIPADIYDRL